MGDPLEHQLLAGKAYGIFVEELDKHLGQAEGFLNGTHSCGEPEYRRLSASFHTIKGGAGFFGFSAIANIAAVLEDTFLQDVSRIEEDLNTAKHLLEELSELAHKLPPPRSLK